MRHHAEPTWYLAESLRASALPASLHDWLLDPGSLTAKLVANCSPRRFNVRLLSQGWSRVLPSESGALGIPRHEVALVREVQLLCDSLPMVFARTLIPVSSLRGRARRLARLREKPLGAVLFADHATLRDLMEIACLQPQHRLHALATRGLPATLDSIWGRRTRFVYAGQPLLVNEIFLPALAGET